jgi:exocyst complex component 5
MFCAEFHILKKFGSKMKKSLFSSAVDPDSLIEPIVRSSSRAGFDPQRTSQELIAALEQLRGMATDVDAQIAKAEQVAAEKQMRSRAKLEAHTRVQRDVFVRMNQLDQRFKQVSSVAVRIGERLGGLDGQRQRATTAMQLADLFDAFNVEDDDFALPQSLQAGADDEAEAAALMQQLEAVAAGLGAPGTEEAVYHIEQQMQTLKNRLVGEFTDASRRRAAAPRDGAAEATALARMRQLSATLLKLDEHEKLYNCYVFSVMETQLAHAANTASVRNELSQLFARIKIVCKREQRVICAVFPPHTAPAVYQRLLSRVFNDDAFGVQARLREWLENPQQHAEDSEEAQSEYLGLLCEAFGQTKALCNSLLRVHEPHAQPLLPRSAEVMASPAAYQSGAIMSGMVSRDFLEELKASLFSEFFTDSQPREHRLLESRCRHTIAEAWAVVTSGAGSAAEAPLNIVAFEQLLSGVLRQNVTTKVFRSCAEATERAHTMASGEGAQFIMLLFKTACSLYGKDYLQPAVARAVELLRQATKGHDQAPLHFFRVVKTLSGRVHQLQTHFEEDVLPKLEHHPTEQTQCLACKRYVTAQLEQSVAQGLKLSVESLIKHVEHRLSAQDKIDYLPKGDLMSLEPTDTCQACIRSIEEQFDEVERCLDASEVDLHVLWKSFGKKLSMVLRKHIRKFKINSLGGVVLTRDIDMYRQTVRRFKSTTVDTLFAQLHELTSIMFSLSAENLRAFLQEGKFNSIQEDELQVRAREPAAARLLCASLTSRLPPGRNAVPALLLLPLLLRTTGARQVSAGLLQSRFDCRPGPPAMQLSRSCYKRIL